MNYCAYCNHEHPAGRRCACPEQQRALQAWTRTLERHQQLERAGMTKFTKRLPLSHWRS